MVAKKTNCACCQEEHDARRPPRPKAYEPEGPARGNATALVCPMGARDMAQEETSGPRSRQRAQERIRCENNRSQPLLLLLLYGEIARTHDVPNLMDAPCLSLP